MKAYILKEEDFEKLTHELAANPKHGANGGSSAILTKEEESIYQDVYRFYNYIVRRWADKAKE